MWQMMRYDLKKIIFIIFISLIIRLFTSKNSVTHPVEEDISRKFQGVELKSLSLEF